MRDVSELEKQILEQELEVIRKHLTVINRDLKNVFAKYGILDGQYKKGFVDYVLSCLISADEEYYTRTSRTPVSYRTTIKAETRTSKIPDALKEIILKWAVKDFMVKVNNMPSTANSVE